MPSYRVGGGVEGAASTLLEHVQRQTKRKEEQEDELRTWNRKVQEIVLNHSKDYSDEAFNAALLGQSMPQGVPLRAAPKLDLGDIKLTQEIEANKRKVEGEQRQQDDASEFIKESALDALSTISEVEQGIGHFGLTGQLPSIPGTSRAKWEANVNKLLSGKVIALMSEMKRVSKTGASGFGQLSQKELLVLQEASTALKRSLSPDDAQQILTEMKMKLRKVAQSEMGGAAGASSTASGLSFSSEEEALSANLPPGTRVTINGRPAIID